MLLTVEEIYNLVIFCEHPLFSITLVTRTSLLCTKTMKWSTPHVERRHTGSSWYYSLH